VQAHHEFVTVQLHNLVHLGALHDDALHAARVGDEQHEAIAHEPEEYVPGIAQFVR
jgi:hypothetical protein